MHGPLQVGEPRHVASLILLKLADGELLRSEGSATSEGCGRNLRSCEAAANDDDGSGGLTVKPTEPDKCTK